MSAPAPTTPTIGAPNATVYVRNLEERIKIPALEKALTAIFSPYGQILEIIAKRNLRGRGQAFVVFDSVTAAETAINEVQGFPLFEKPMVLAFAKTKSDATVKREAGEESREFEAHKRRRLAEKERKQAQAALDAARVPGAPAAAAGGDKSKKPGAPATAGGLKSTAPAAAPAIADEYLPPNTTLFLRELPEDATAEMLTDVFGRFDGFKEVRMVPGRAGIAFVEYQTLEGAIQAKEQTAGMPMGEKMVRVTYQRQ